MATTTTAISLTDSCVGSSPDYERLRQLLEYSQRLEQLRLQAAELNTAPLPICTSDNTEPCCDWDYEWDTVTEIQPLEPSPLQAEFQRISEQIQREFTLPGELLGRDPQPAPEPLKPMPKRKIYEKPIRNHRFEGID